MRLGFNAGRTLQDYVEILSKSTKLNYFVFGYFYVAF